jgi:pimeloyl-ACP methyl ester carboxylesterase
VHPRILLALAALSTLDACARAPARAEPPGDRADATHVIADFRKIVSPRGIEVLESVQIGGIPQWLSIRGADRANPVLLYLHGGPGYPGIASGWTQRSWEDYFTVVHWDQRGTGKTYAANDPAKIGPTITLERMIADAEEVVSHLRERLGKQKIFVVGHSWGTVLGTLLVQRHPEWFHAYVGTGQVVAFRENERLGYEFAVERARADDNAEAIAALAKIAPYPETDGHVVLDELFVQRRWLQHYGGAVHHRRGYAHEFAMMELSPDYTARDLASAEFSGVASVTRLLPELERIDFRTATRFAVPVFLFLGRHDYNTPSSLAAAWFDQLEAPGKRLIWFERSAHMMHSEEPGKMLVQLVELLRPIAAQAGDVAPDREP